MLNNKNLKTIKFYDLTKKILLELAIKKRIPKDELEWYFKPSDLNMHNYFSHIWEFYKTKKINTWQQGAMMSFVLHSQNQTGNHINNIVKYSENINYIYEILLKFNPTLILEKYGSDICILISELKNKRDSNGDRVFKWKESEKNRAITLWCQSIISSAKFIKKCKNRTDLIEKLNSCWKDGNYMSGKNKGKKDLSKVKSNLNIPGFGTALTCDLLKEFDPIFCDVIKPDFHIKDVLNAFNSGKLSLKNDNDYYNNFIEIVNDIRRNGTSDEYKNLTGYKFDKMIWLICSGSFYMHDNSNSKIDYIRRIKEIS